MKKSNKNLEKARKLADLTFQMKKICSDKEAFLASKYNLTSVEFRCLNYLRGHDYLIVKDLSDMMNLTPSRITRLITSLEDKKLIRRELDDKDRRNVRVYPLEKSKDKIDEMDMANLELHLGILDMVPNSEIDKSLETLEGLNKIFHDWHEKALKGRVPKNLKY